MDSLINDCRFGVQPQAAGGCAITGPYFDLLLCRRTQVIVPPYSGAVTTLPVVGSVTYFLSAAAVGSVFCATAGPEAGCGQSQDQRNRAGHSQYDFHHR